MPLEIGDEIWCQKTRIMVLAYRPSEEIMTNHLGQSTSVTDRQTDGRTELRYGDYKSVVYEYVYVVYVVDSVAPSECV